MTNYSTYYLPIQSSTLAHYFGAGLILPASFYPNKPGDIQNFSERYILLSQKKWVKTANCSIEIVLNEQEFNLYRVSENFLLLEGAIPLSRIKRIYFLKDDQRKNTLWNINSSTAFVPETLTALENTNVIFTDHPEIKTQPIQAPASDIAEKAKRYNILLGGLAFMKVAAEKDEEFSKHYFPTVGYFNNLIHDQALNAFEHNRESIDVSFTGLFSTKDVNWTKWQKYIYKRITIDDIVDLAKQEGLSLERKLGLFNLEHLDKSSVLFDLALLSIYGDMKHKSTEDLLSYLFNNNLSKIKIEEICLIFGLNNGYKQLRNKYKVQGREIDVKFHLTSQVDYYIIESIFQFVFNSRRDNRHFDYLDNFIPKRLETRLSYKDDFILDIPVHFKKKEENSFGDEYFQNVSYEILTAFISEFPETIHPFKKEEVNKDLALKYFQQAVGPRIIDALKRVCKEKDKEHEEELMNLRKRLDDLLQSPIIQVTKEKEKVASDGIDNLNNIFTPKLSVPDAPAKDSSLRDSASTILINQVKDEVNSLTFEELVKKAEELGIKVTKKKKSSKTISELKKAILSRINL